MDKVQELVARLNELHGLVDGLRVEVEGYGVKAQSLQPSLQQLAQVERDLAEKNAALLALTQALASAQADYERMKAHFDSRPL